MSSTVEDWLRSLGLIQYTQAFLDNGYDELDICKEMGEEDLDAIGVKNTRDRVDILSAVNRLKQSGTAVYFVLEDSTQQPTPNVQAREKILPLKLKMFLSDTLEEDNIKLSDYPYTLSSGLRGNLETLVTLYADKFYTYEDDVFEALESIRVRQVGEMQEQLRRGPEVIESPSPSSESKTKKHHQRSHTGPLHSLSKEPSGWNTIPASMKIKDTHHVVDPADYLDVDTQSSPHKKVKRRRPVERNSKLSRSLDSLKELHVNQDIKTKADKDTSTNKSKQSSIFGIFRSSKRKNASLDEKSSDTKSISSVKSVSESSTSNVMMSEEDRVALMLMVKNGDLTVEEAVQQIESFEKEQRKASARQETRTSSSCSEEDSPKGHHKLKRGIFGRSTKKKTPSRPGSEIAACDMTMSEEDRINLMKAVRDHEITVDDAVRKLYSFEESSSVPKPKSVKPKYSPKSPHTFSRISIKRVSAAFTSGRATSKEESNSVFYTPPEGASSEDDSAHVPSDSSPDPSPAGHRKPVNDLVRSIQQNQIHSTSSLHSSSSSSDAVDRLGNSDESRSPVKQGAVVDEMKTIFSKKGSLERQDQYLSKTSSLPRNGSSRPKLASLSRKGSLPLTKPPPPPPSRKIPVPPPRTLQKQVTEPLLKTSGIVRDISNSISEVPETEVKPPLAPPRKRGEDFKNELEGKLACQPSSLPVDQDQRGQTVDNEHSKASPVNTRNTYRDSLEDDVFPPLPPEVVLKEEFREEKENKRIIIKPPRPSLRPPQKPAEQNTLEKTIKDDERPSETAAAPPPAAESNQSNNISATKPIPIGPPVGKHTPVPQPPAKPFSVPSSVSKPDVVAPPSIKPKPIVKKKPKLPPKPPNKPGSSFKYEEPDECGAEMSQDQASSLNVPDFRVPRKRPSHSLSDLIERRLRIEQIDLTERPYTSVVGKWGIPINLVDRYTEEMRRSQKEVVEVLDRIRCTKLKEKGRMAIPCDVSLFPQEPDHVGQIDSLETWLVSLGLPMYIDNLREVEYDDMSAMPYLKQKHFEYAGVVDLRHMRRLLASVERMPR